MLLLLTRTTGERCSLPKYSIHKVLTVLVKTVITFNALSHLSPALLLPVRAVHLHFQLLNYLFGPMLETVPHPASCQRHAWGQKFGDCTTIARNLEIALRNLKIGAQFPDSKCAAQSRDCANS